MNQYYSTESIIHKLDARLKLLMLIVFSTQVFIIGWAGYLLIILFIFSCIKLSNVPAMLFFKGISKISFLILFTSLLNVIFGSSFVIAIEMTVRILLLVTLTSLVTLTTSPSQFTYALSKLFCSQDLAMIMSIALRFIPIITNEFKLIRNAQISRGVNFKSRSIFKNYSRLLIPILVLSFKCADDLSIAMEARQFGKFKSRSSLHEPKLSRHDLIAFVISFCICVLVMEIDKAF